MTDSTPDARTRILDAAELAFADHGLAGARTAAITHAANVNKAMLYYYFDNKQSLYNAVLERVFEQIVHLAESIGADVDDPPAVALTAFMNGYAKVLAEHPHIVRIVLRSVLDAGPSAFSTMAPKFGRVLPLVAGQVVRGQAEGSVNPALMAPLVPPAFVAPVVFIALAGPLLSSLTGADPDAIRTMWLDNTRELLLNGLNARPQETTS